jgi:hypothetical protein
MNTFRRSAFASRYIALFVLILLTDFSPSFSQDSSGTPIPTKPFGPTDGFSIGDQATVHIEGNVLLLYAEANIDAAVLEALINGVVVTIIGGPQKSDDIVWWEVQSPSGNEGWVQESINGQPVLVSPTTLVEEEKDIPQTSVPGEDNELKVGDKVTVFIEDNMLLLYSEPSEESDILEALMNGVDVTILDGPVTVDNVVWWQILSPSRSEGWIVSSINGQPVLIGPEAKARLNATHTPSPTPSPSPTPTPVHCPGVLPPRLVIGAQGRITPGPPNNLRQQPSIRSAKIGSLPAGGVFRVISGPVCSDGYAYWEVEYNGKIGWTAEGNNYEYWAEPYP